ncbi:DNA gyrase inhibitor YacG [Psychrobacter sp. I-STPA6b]|uniref:DNA gyrase inhibitor YacG n=1 Tax=Psychrobacter sp. I-STPA6b TaxID=2585718 RepID=UPI001D0CC538|nr:DNA gyrase inhibitor YacG [Psychrobacter sp. I-STPA6b]
MTQPHSNTPKMYPCPRCKTATTWQDNPYKPFCSERCKLIDLGAWANEDYKIASADSPFSTELPE